MNAPAVPPGSLQLKVLTPTQVLVDTLVVKVVAEAPDGFFCLLPRHVDFVAPLVPSILYLTAPDGGERLVAVDEGTLVKCGAEVLVSAMHAVEHHELSALQSTVAETYLAVDDEERRARSALARLEAGAVRRLVELERQGHG